ncbi:NUDIX hydrolase [Halocatena halophila]|uniref:NUDIX hydrolase n=1 Tax=Halocatena halophila TaxID=2814576 RepID=UPI002ED1C1B1
MLGQKAVETQLEELRDKYGELAVETTEKEVSSSAIETGRRDVREGNTVDVRVWTTRGNEEVLLVREHDAPEYWIEPGGTVEPGEPIDAAAHREVAEETGIDCRIAQPRAVRQIVLRDETDPDQSAQFLQVFFNAIYNSGNLSINDDEILDAQWMTTLPDGFYSHVGTPSEWTDQ